MMGYFDLNAIDLGLAEIIQIASAPVTLRMTADA